MKIEKKKREITTPTSISLRPSQYQKIYDLAFPETVSKYIRDWIDGLKPLKKK